MHAQEQRPRVCGDDVGDGLVDRVRVLSGIAHGVFVEVVLLVDVLVQQPVVLQSVSPIEQRVLADGSPDDLQGNGGHAWKRA